MLVSDRMSRPVITISPQTTLGEALHLMHREHIRRLPVVNKNGDLIGIVSERQLLKAAPSDATMLDVWEVRAVMDRVTIDKIMVRDVVTVTTDTPIEDAARIMADSKIGGVPVVKDNKVVGIITETDLFKAFLEVMGARERGTRLSVIVSDAPGQLARITRSIYEAGGNIISLGTFLGTSSGSAEITVKVTGLSQEKLIAAVKPFVDEVKDVRETGVS